MPVTAKLLQRLHETLGDEATNDLLDLGWPTSAPTSSSGCSSSGSAPSFPSPAWSSPWSSS